MKPGDKVTYNTRHQLEKGVVKRLCDDPDYVFVVYHCNNDWSRYTDYTAARTAVTDLTEGWDV